MGIVSVAAFAILPAVVIVVLFAGTLADDAVAPDFLQFYRAAEAILAGDDPYVATDATTWGGPFPYPPLPALGVAPLTLLPLEAAGLLVMATLVLVALAIPFVLGVRDWRCYGLVLLWPPVISAIQTGNVTLWFALAAALVWRFRERATISGSVLGLTLAAKFFLWPLVAWLAATRRIAGTVIASLVGIVALVGSWAAIGFDGMREYPSILHDLEEVVGEDSYTAYIVALDVGLPSEVARGLWLTIGLALVAAAILLARHGDERTSFVLGITAALALTPIVWLHYFALLLVVVALVQPRLGLLWFLPLGMVVTPGSGHPSPFETGATLAIAALIVGVAVRTSAGAYARTNESTPPRVSARTA